MHLHQTLCEVRQICYQDPGNASSDFLVNILLGQTQIFKCLVNFRASQVSVISKRMVTKFKWSKSCLFLDQSGNLLIPPCYHRILSKLNELRQLHRLKSSEREMRQHNLSLSNGSIEVYPETDKRVELWQNLWLSFRNLHIMIRQY